MIFQYFTELICLLDAARYVFLTHGFDQKFKVGDNITVTGLGSINLLISFENKIGDFYWKGTCSSRTINAPQGMHCIVLETKKHRGEHYIRVLSPKGIGWAAEYYFEKRR